MNAGLVCPMYRICEEEVEQRHRTLPKVFLPTTLARPFSLSAADSTSDALAVRSSTRRKRGLVVSMPGRTVVQRAGVGHDQVVSRGTPLGRPICLPGL